MNAAAPGTIKNRQRQAQVYIEFAVCFKFDYLHPPPVYAAMYAQHLANMHSSPASLKNYISGAKHWITSHLGDPSAFLSQPVQEVVARLIKTSDHTPAQALPITPGEIKIIIDFLDGSPNYPLAVKPCILITYACMFRSSNAVSPSARIWGGAHTLRAADIIESGNGLDVIIRSTKTTSRAKPTTIHVEPVASSNLCPVMAWRLYYGWVSPPPSGPAFLHVGGFPITAGPVVSAIRAALAAAGYMDTSKYSMHSLRRGSAQLASSMGASSTDIMRHGVWRSESGLRHYVPPVPSSVPRTIARGLAN